MDEFDLWKLSERLTVIEAVCLALNHDPLTCSNITYPERASYLPSGVVPVIKAVEQAINAGHLKAHIENRNFVSGGSIHTTLNIANSTVDAGEFAQWLRSKAVPSPFFHAEVTPIAQKDADTFKTIERKTALKLIIGMAVACYAFDPKAKRSDAVATIEGDLNRMGIQLDQDTIRKWLKEASAHLPAQTEDLPSSKPNSV